MIKADVVVVGLGAFGAATLYQLARAGVSAVGIDRFAPPHDQGSSHGDTRITRAGVGEGEAYVPFALRSHEIWRELEGETGEQLYLDCGFLVIDGAENAQFHGKSGIGKCSVRAARNAGIPHSVLTPAEAMRAFPRFRLRGHELVYFEPGGGLVFPERCIAAQLSAARRLGARAILNETVASVTPVAGGVEVTTASGLTIAAERAVIAAGGWAPAMVGAPLAPMRLLRQTLHWFEPEDWRLYAPENCPTFIWTHGAEPEASFYGFPAIAGMERRGVKIATEQYTRAIERPEAMERDVAPPETAELFAEHIAGRMAGLKPNALHAAACVYTMAPDGDFVIDHHPDSERITVVSACSGHGFKHSAGAGEFITRLTLGEIAGAIGEFRLARPAFVSG
ncbi:MAG: N-methyl-L-tryptophan oxidase [Candidatus Andeanibacterium colombiense]|uniref:N-methyl-L-tryptophan oxidase n=1 Tax=Candidatus Andeanibacterium colombiense TaxID=3121345 RepID=A0AAJ5X6H8_9SPHN|nr:MAG: N-methyl-L-tryptophan oxidase [Sphingomonadaceae bacterium]